MPIHMQNFKKFCWKLSKKILKTTFFCYIVARDERLKVSRRRGALPPPKKFFIVPRRPPSSYRKSVPAGNWGYYVYEMQAARTTMVGVFEQTGVAARSSLDPLRYATLCSD